MMVEGGEGPIALHSRTQWMMPQAGAPGLRGVLLQRRAMRASNRTRTHPGLHTNACARTHRAGTHKKERTSNGQVAVSAFGSGCACPTAVIAICPICQCSAEPQLEVCSAVHSSSLCPLAAFASWALQGYACMKERRGGGSETQGFVYQKA